MKKAIAMVLCLVMLVGAVFTGCGANGNSIVGTWETDYDMAEIMNVMLSMGLGSDPGLKDINLRMSMTFTEDGKCTMAVDETSIEPMINALSEQLVPLFSEMYGDSVEITVDDVKEMMSQNIDTDALTSSMNTSCNYMVKDGNLYMSNSASEAVTEESTCAPYTIEGDTLTIEAGEDADAASQLVFPMVLKRAA